jgi:hypothetical protein
LNNSEPHTFMKTQAQSLSSLYSSSCGVRTCGEPVKARSSWLEASFVCCPLVRVCIDKVGVLSWSTSGSCLDSFLRSCLEATLLSLLGDISVDISGKKELLLLPEIYRTLESDLGPGYMRMGDVVTDPGDDKETLSSLNPVIPCAPSSDKFKLMSTRDGGADVGRCWPCEKTWPQFRNITETVTKRAKGWQH